MKKFLLLVIFSLGSLCFCQEPDDDFDDIFNDAQDVTAEENDRINRPKDSDTITFDISKVKFYGKLKSEMGLIYGQRFGDLYEKKLVLDEEDGKTKEIEGDKHRRRWLAGYIDFENNLSFVARADESFAIHGNLCTTFFPIDWINKEKSTIYFDYMAGPYCLVSAGKKNLDWGYVRIFNNTDDYSQEERLTTNIVADSESSIVGTMTFPLGILTATGVILYNLDSSLEFSKDDPPKVDELSYAGSLEFYFLQASLNLYGRRTARNQSLESTLPEDVYGIKNVVGLEFKRTFFGFDCYAQNTFSFWGKSKRYTDSYIMTFGSYRIWNIWGYNAEFQKVRKIHDNKDIYRYALDLGVKNVGPKRDLKLAVQWRHDSNRFSNAGEYLDNCWVKVGFVKSNFFKHLDWNNGVQIFYEGGDNPRIYQVRLASYFTLDVGY